MVSNEAKRQTETRELAACLLAVGQHQDRTAFHRLFIHFAPRIKAYGARLGSTQTQAEELAQDTMVKIWRKAHLFDPAKSAPSTWVFRIARNQRIDSFRREHHPEFDPNDPCFIPDSETPADMLLEQAEAEDNLARVIKTLPEEQKNLLHMAFFQDMSHSDIAQQESLPLGTVKSRLRLALAKLRKQLDGPSGPLAEESAE
ncbi:MAG: sigma-70 family RNA polymerase sigma factor [Parvibaculum sp.]|nr:sigma-70 family RNA polymerase sigma factor [Parvibaculum sp.]